MDDDPTLELLMAWDDGRRLGVPPSAEELCPDDPERRERLARRIEELRRAYEVLPDPEQLPLADDGPVGEVPGIDVLEEIGRGGMGVVFKGWQPELGRFVAVKMLAAGPLAGERALARFQAEARTVAGLDHPNIVGVHLFGEHRGRPFLVLEHLPGGNLAQALARSPLSPRRAAGLAATLARAVQHAHDRGVVHRDLKPANILLTDAAEPKVADFGLARILDGERGATWTGEILGTPAYMSPEQAAGDPLAVGPAVDIHALGAILYEMLTGRPPFQGTSRVETLELVRHQEPVPPRRLRPSIPRDLENVCLKCLRKEPWRRYATAEGLAEDLGRFLAGRPVLARPIGLPERAVRLARRHPAAATAAAAALGLVAALAAAVAWAERRESDARVRGLILALESAETAGLARPVGEIRRDLDRARPLLRLLAQNGPRGRLHAALALARDDPAQAAFVVARLLGATPGEVAAILAALGDGRESVAPGLWDVALDPSEPAERRARAACALADASPDDPRWASLGPDLARWLSHGAAAPAGAWALLLRPVAPHLLPTLAGMLLGDDPDTPPARVAADLYGCLADGPAAFAWLEGGSGPGDAGARAAAAAALARVGRPGLAWELLRLGPDPATRDLLIGRLARAEVPPGLLADRFEAEPDAPARHALALALGEAAPARLTLELREALVVRMLGWYRRDPDPGVHSALGLTLDRWEATTRVRAIDHELELVPPDDGQGWLVNGQGQLFSVASMPGGAQVAVAIKEVVNYQFERFTSRSRQVTWKRPFLGLGPAGDAPALGVLWHEAAAYCNWLSRVEGFAEDDFCYLPNPDPDARPPLVSAPDLDRRAGYRLLTAEEWRALAAEGGRPGDRLDLYAWTESNARGRAWPVGLLRPDERGLFDLLGNALEILDDPGGPAHFAHAGGSFLRPSGATPIVEPGPWPQQGRHPDAGFRTARTLIPATPWTAPGAGRGPR